MQDVELVEEWKKVTERLMAEDGYLVCGLLHPVPIGFILSDKPTGLPWKIVEECTYEDAVRQYKVLSSMAHQDEDCVLPPKEYHFYKAVVAD